MELATEGEREMNENVSPQFEGVFDIDPFSDEDDNRAAEQAQAPTAASATGGGVTTAGATFSRERRGPSRGGTHTEERSEVIRAAVKAHRTALGHSQRTLATLVPGMHHVTLANKERGAAGYPMYDADAHMIAAATNHRWTGSAFVPLNPSADTSVTPSSMSHADIKGAILGGEKPKRSKAAFVKTVS